jgi:hypothetical protein
MGFRFICFGCKQGLHNYDDCIVNKAVAMRIIKRKKLRSREYVKPNPIQEPLKQIPSVIANEGNNEFLEHIETEMIAYANTIQTSLDKAHYIYRKSKTDQRYRGNTAELLGGL